MAVILDYWLTSLNTIEPMDELTVPKVLYSNTEAYLEELASP